MTVTDYPDWQTPQAHADRIAVTGVPLLRATNELSNGADNALAGGATQQILASKAVSQPGYEVGVSVYMPASSGTKPFIQLTLYFWDSITGLFTNRRDVVVPAGNGSTEAIECYLRGPMSGDMFRVDATNLDPAVTATLAWFVNQTSHVYETDQARQYAYTATAPNGFTNASGVPTTGMVAHASPTVPASSSSTVLCALYGGDVYVDVINPSATLPVTMDIRDPAGLATGAANSHFYNATIAANSSLSVNLTLPFTPVTVQFTNSSTAATVTPSLSIIGQQH